MDALKKYPIEKEAEKVLNALKEKGQPVINALKNYNIVVTRRRENWVMYKLPTLIRHLSKVSKRKTLEGRYDNLKLGLNCNGLGYEWRWGNQLNSFDNNTNFNIKMLWGIMTDDDLSLEIQQEIISSNRTNFMKLVNKMKKISMPTFNVCENIKAGDFTIVFDADKTPSFLLNDKVINCKLISEEDICEFQNDQSFRIKDIVDAEILMENIDEIVNILEIAKKEVENKTKQEAELSDFIENLLNVFEAMEKI